MENQLTGVELIAKERQEQIEKHGFSSLHDQQHSESVLIFAAAYALEPTIYNKRRLEIYVGWDNFIEKIEEKSQIERYAIVGALMAAEIDRLNYIENGK